MANNKKIKIGDEMVGQFQATVLLRALGDNKLKALYDEYKAARHNHKTAVEPSLIQFKAAQKMQEHKNTPREIADDLGLTRAQVYASVTRVAVWEYLKK